MSCDYIKNSNEPCHTCPRLMTCLYRCDFLKEGIPGHNNTEEEEEEEDE